ncbi:adenosylcobinamide-GDP ribazoletransferase [Opitutus sp. ER46]|uniref:adenosylcobinamide-GDP ribazoletransferase n=1 Tax=Opitutus sp. ER46 TaxID=2161864 RepID=UPI000D31859F|nr:adenosylcobinamide-GDP ribazoletransferase [Opitutus sp. ER46]PTX92391.1 adenosylcobinamide-GDP ribazoletransferase [Opitutus sp. ER46]
MNALVRELRALRGALTFFTRLPAPGAGAVDGEDLKASPRYFALVGAVVGAVGALVWWLAARVLPGDVAVLLSMAATVLVTGAFHEDAFADVCDGFGGGYDRERVLVIMKDSRVGAFGVVGIGLMLGLKAVTLMHVPAALMVGVLVAAHAVSRAAAMSLMLTLPYVRADDTSKSRPVANPPTAASVVVAGLCGLAPFALLPARMAWALLPVVLARVTLGRWFARRIGGYTGDCLGATQQVAEVMVYLTVVALA